MLDNLFRQTINMSVTGSMVILFVLAARFLLQKAPKSYSYALWSVVLFRLICPFSFESVWSLLPTKAAPLTQNIVYLAQPQINTGVMIINDLVNTALPAAAPHVSINSLFIGGLIWGAGMAALFAYGVITLLKLKKQLQSAVHCRDNIYLTHQITTPFVMGVVRPRVYLPVNLSEKEQEFILLHEQTHIRRFDHIIKLLSFFVLTIHWFNPLVWLGFFLSAKDMEMSCDEAVVKKLGRNVKKEYSASLLALATGRPTVGGTPLAFGEGDTKGRIKNLLRYQEPGFWLVIVATVGVLCVIVGLMINPKGDNTIRTETESLWARRTQYVGDNSAVGGIISALGFPENVYYKGFTLFTAERPYGIEIGFNTDTETRNFYTGALNEGPFQENAMIMFSLIENAEHITFTLDDGVNPYSVGPYTRDWAEAVMGGGDLFARTKTKDGIEALQKEISVTVSEGLEEHIKHHQQWVGQENVTFFVKLDEPPEVIANTAAELWLKSFLSADVPAESRISDYTIVGVTVVAGEPKAGEKWEEMKYHYVVQVEYNITSATEDYFAPGDGVSGKGTFEGLFRELCVKTQENGQFEIVSVGTGGGEGAFAPPSYSQSLTAGEHMQTEEMVRHYFTNEVPYYEGVVSISVAPDDFAMYQNTGIEAEFEPGNILIYKVLTGRDKKDGNPERAISIARKTADSPWEIINHGY